jgi:hypothetical protein
MHIYQLTLKGMQLHPVSRISFHIARPIDRGKKRAEERNIDDIDENTAGSLTPNPAPTKRIRPNENADISMADLL